MAYRSIRDEISRNKRSSIILVVAVSIILMGLVFTLSYSFSPDALYIILPLSFILIFLYSWGSYQYGDRIVLASTNARLAESSEYTYYRDTVEGLSMAAGIPTPEAYIVPNNELNAFATGKNAEKSSIAVTTGLLNNLNRQELEGVIAHEMSHIKNRDIQFMTLVAVLVGLAAILSHIILRSYRWGRVSRGRGGRGRDRESGLGLIIILIGFILAIFAPLLTRIIQFTISRKREFLADASGAELTRYPEGLASALEKIGQHNQGNMNVSEAVSHLFISDPNKSALDALYATHPPIEDRIQRLREM